MPIRILDAATVGRIAAGEVVERPASVVKELIENALDAGSTSITVEIQNGGIDYLRVSDNGCGIAPGEARLAFENHATSKLTAGDDLGNILTLGFRGEALPSVAAVAKVEMTTRQRGAESGIKLSVSGGKNMQLSEIGCPDGTTIVVRELFFNTPVRRTFLKKPNYEAGVISDMVSKLILGNPNVSIRLINNGKTVYHSFGDGNLRHAALAVHGRDVAEGMLSLDESEGGMRIYGLLGVGECARSNRSQQAFFINGRLVHCALLTNALEEACKGRVMASEHPICALNVALPPHAVDVNVHPNKLEVRFRDEAAVRQSVEALFARALGNSGMLNLEKLGERKPPVYQPPDIRVERAPEHQQQTVVFNKQTEVYNKQTEVQKMQTEVSNEKPSDRVAEPSAEQPHCIVQSFPERGAHGLKESLAPAPHVFPTPVEPEAQSRPHRIKPAGESAMDAAQQPLAGHAKPMRIIGSAFNAYVFIEIEGAVLIIDQHAAHERLLYEQYKSLLETENIAQRLLTPLILNVSKREMGLLMDNQQLLDSIGYEIEPFGETAVRLLSVPHVLGQAELTPLFMSMLEQLDQLKNAAYDTRRSDIIQFCCKRAVKAGDRLSEDEVRALIGDMLQSGAPPTCPHGRPVLKKLAKSEIERFFRR